MWQITGCQHSLVQTCGNDYSPPTIPALSLKGFSRWESLEILLGPEEHVPFIQYAVKNWNLRHPVSGEAFPADLPSDVFPAHADADVDKWHSRCADRLWQEATTERAAEHERERGRGSSPEKHEPRFTYVHVKPPKYPSPPQTARGDHPRSEHARPDHGRPDQSRRPLYTHVPRHGGSGSHGRQQMPSRSPEPPRESPSDVDGRRRRSFSDIPSPTAADEPPHNYSNSQYIDPGRRPTNQQQRRHSQPRHFSSESSEDEHAASSRHSRDRHRHQQSPPTPPYTRRNLSQQPSSAAARTQRSDIRDSSGGAKRPLTNSPRGSIREKVSEKVSNIFSSRPPERPHNDMRRSSYQGVPAVRPRGNRAPAPPRPAKVESDIEDSETSDSETSEDEPPRRPALRSREDRERDHYRDRVRPYPLDRELDDDIESPAARRTRQHLRRPDTTRRTSSHADVDRRRDGPAWDPRDKERGRLRDERKRYNERRSPDHDRRSPSPLTGVTGRRYPEAAAY